jgi:hypothetical protein
VKIRLCLALLLCRSLAVAAPITLSTEDFKMYRHYLNALQDPRVQKMKESGRLGAIAKDAGYKVNELKAAIARGEAAGDLKVRCEENLKAELQNTEVGQRLSKAEADLTVPHAVAYVQWLNENPANLEEEASALASAASRACPVVSSIQVWAMDGAHPKTRTFQGLISRSAAANIKPERIRDFADTRYIRLFENVKSAAKGDDLTAEMGAAPKVPAH